MKKIKRDVSLTTKIRNNMNRIQDEFYSHDTNSAVIELTMDRTDLKKVIVLFHFQRSNRFLEVIGNVTGNVVEVPFDTSLITVDETVTGYVYIEKVVQSADVCKFSFGVRVSEIDKHKDLPVIEKDSKRIVAITEIVTKSELQEALKDIHVEGSNYDDSAILQRIQALEASQKIDTSVFATKSELKERVSRLESKPEADTSSFVTKQELNGKGYLTAHQPLTEYAKKTELPQPYNDTEIKERVSRLESKPEADTSALVTKQELASKGYLTAHQPLTEYAKKSEIPQSYNDTDLKQRVSRLESKPEIDTSTLVTKQELENKGYLTQHQPLTEYAKKSELPQPYNDTDLKRRVQTLETKSETVGVPQKLSIAGNVVTLSDGGGSITLPTAEATTSGTSGKVSEYEIHGTGMPNGKVTAPIGTTYVDTAVTNGALKWIKQSGSGNTGWKVLIGDTGWRTLNSVSRVGNSFIKIRRVNNLVTYQFGGLQWGWFGVGRRNGPGFVRHNSSGDKGAKLTYPNGIPEGFRSENSLVGPTYDDKGRPYGIWYLGGKSDLNFIQFTFNDPIPTDRDIGDIRVSAISYLTDEDWPTTLP